MNTAAEQSTIPSLIRNIVKNIHPDTQTFMSHKVGDTWVDISYRQALEKIDAISAWLLSIGIKKGDRLALIIENGPDYIYYDQALQQIGAVLPQLAAPPPGEVGLGWLKTCTGKLSDEQVASIISIYINADPARMDQSLNVLTFSAFKFACDNLK